MSRASSLILMLGLVGGTLLHAAVIFTPTVPVYHTSGFNPNWTTENVDVTSQADTDLKLDLKGVPQLGYYPPGSVRYATRTALNWSAQEVAATPFGGGYTCLATSSNGTPHAFYSLDGLQHRWLDHSVWLQELVEPRQPGLVDRQCQAAFDRQDVLHLIWASST